MYSYIPVLYMSIETLLKGYSSKNYLEGMEHQFIIFLLVGVSKLWNSASVKRF